MKFKNYFLAISMLSSFGLTAQTVTSEIDGSNYSLSFNGLEIKIDTAHGAKVSSLTLNGETIIVPLKGGDQYSYGSTLWLGPQNEWNWPPPFNAIENGSYSSQVSETTLSFESIEDMGMIVNKSFKANTNDTSVSIKYKMTNVDNTAKTHALWELSRVPVEGITFWPTGTKGTWNTLASSVVEEKGLSWLNINAESRRSLKFMADGAEGWYAHVNNDRKIFIKTFDDVDQSEFASGEGEIELWIAPNFVELENLSAVKVIEPNNSIEYEVKWYLREVPANISLEVGNIQLVNFVEKTLGLDLTTGIAQYEEFACFAYPNPANNYIQFSWSEKFGANAELTVYDAMGKTQFSKTIEKGSMVDVQELKSGIFFYSISMGNNLKNGRFIKQ